MTDDRRAIAALLLVVQAGLELLAALGLYSFARLTASTAILAAPELVAFGGSLVLLLLAIGVLRSWRFARMGVYVWESLTLLGTAFSVVASAGSALTWPVALTGLALPGIIVFFVRNRESTTRDFRQGLLIGLLLGTAVIHLALAPEHMTQAPRLGPLFLLDAAALIAVCIAIARDAKWWRGPTAALLLASIVAYVFVVIMRKEDVDDLGIATKVIELVAFGLTVWPAALRPNWRLVLPTASLITTIVLSGGLAWAASLRPLATDNHRHDGKVFFAAPPPTDAQRLAATQLVDDTRMGTERFSDVNVALGDGYAPTTPASAPTVHYINPKYVKSGQVDPMHPQGLVYATTPSGQLLLGAMYMMAKANIRPPDVAGSPAEWHTHSNLCFGVPGFAIVGFESPFGTCPVGSINAPTPAMLHVWTVPNPAGPFADLSPAFLARLTRGS